MKRAAGVAGIVGAERVGACTRRFRSGAAGTAGLDGTQVWHAAGERQGRPAAAYRDGGELGLSG